MKKIKRIIKTSKSKKIIKNSKIKETPKNNEMELIRKRIEEKMKGSKLPENPVTLAEFKNNRNKIKNHAKIKNEKILHTNWIKTGIEGFDELTEHGIPKGLSVLVVGGPGTGKTIFCLQMLANAAKKGEKCLYITFEESEERLKQHMRDFGWNPDELIKKGVLQIKKLNPFDVTRSVEALMEQSKGELMIDVEPIEMPKGFKPDRIVIDSLSAIASAFVGKEESYRMYIEQLFNFFQKFKTTTFLITEIVELAKSMTEEFMADGVIVFYYIKHGNSRERAIEILKLRGAKHQEKIVAFQIMDNGIVVYPEQEVFGDMES
ncbi:MAG: ATPase domain-containing protein [Candidatus Aenigmarchaeota archaeon]|nr:ATPase domain-containing protein [Candidatus Aenigmarchaeota archaeon]